MQATLAKENRGRREPPVYHFRKHKKKVEKDLSTLWTTRVNAHTNETVSRIFCIPVLVPTMPQDFRHLPYPGGERLRELAGQRDPGIFIQYFVKVIFLQNNMFLKCVTITYGTLGYIFMSSPLFDVG